VPGLLFYSTSPYFYSVPHSLKENLNGDLLQNLAFVGSGLLAGVTYLAPNDQLRGPERLKVILGYWPHLSLLFGVVVILSTAVIRQMASNTRGAIPQSKPVVFLVWLIIASCLFSLLFAAATGMSWLPRHGAFIFFAIALLVPSTFCRPTVLQRSDAVLRKVAIGATVVLMLMNGLALHNYYFDPNYAKDDYRAVATYVNQHVDADTASILLWGNIRLLQYYGDIHTVSHWNLTGKNLVNQVSNIAGNSDQLLLLVNRERSLLNYSVEDVLKDIYLLNDKITFSNFTIYQFQAR
jgi:hypothetical protein